MKKILILICCLIGYAAPVWACSVAGPSVRYEVKDGQVYYQQDYQSEPVLVEGADVATFISNRMYSNNLTEFEKRWNFTHYASDTNHVYYRGRVLEGVNSEQAVLLEENLLDVYITEGMEQFSDYDGYLKDNELVYYRGRLLEGADGGSLGWMPMYQRNPNSLSYVRDQYHIYFYGQKVAGDPKTAFALHHGYYLDAQHIYFRGKILEGASPDAFEQLTVPGGHGWPSVFIVSNKRVFYRGDQLPLDADSFEVLDIFSGPDYVTCGGGTYAGSLLKDRNGVYILHADGRLEHQSAIDAATFQLIPKERFPDKRWIAMQWAVDQHQMYYYWSYKTNNREGRSMVLHILSLTPQKTNQEKLFLDERVIDTYYKDGQSIYRDEDIFSTWKIQNMGEELGIDVKTFDTYATLLSAVIFKDNNMFYLRAASKGSTELITLAPSDAKLVCLEKSHLCLLKGNTLYFVSDDGRVNQTQVNTTKLHCVEGGRLYSGPLTAYSENGVCFDDKQYYQPNGQKQVFSNGSYRLDRNNEWYNAHDYSLQYAVTEDELEKIRLRSLERLHIERQPFLD
ncbi:hypothetical protein CUZ56_02571 [Saezia sanguinis]|uniref:DKNYY family protein n=1 Tax=Saezia sanguinis TaxID=1965230 RepID=A0A433SAF0_9BURK|nr:DKNYY domain-containing protein [Saezia sanguinis]RUS65726.1 hypothetical protein CUZ56_02571 [Saezia sanguinis]